MISLARWQAKGLLALAKLVDLIRHPRFGRTQTKEISPSRYIDTTLTRRRLALQTVRANDIDNEQLREIDVTELNAYLGLERRYGLSVESRGGPTPIYNCHGLTFASRRTGITASQQVNNIIADDRYQEVARADVKPGDLILYYYPSGDVEHSGVVVEAPDHIGIPRIFSKWGKGSEMIHLGNECPYNFPSHKYFRVNL